MVRACMTLAPVMRTPSRQILLGVTALHAGHAGLQFTAAIEKILDQRREWLQRRGLCHLNRTLAQQVDAGEKGGYFEPPPSFRHWRL
jgi:hypothetical protein